MGKLRQVGRFLVSWEVSFPPSHLPTKETSFLLSFPPSWEGSWFTIARCCGIAECTMPKEGPERPISSAAPLSDQLVTVESQQELDVFSGRWEERTFVKLYVAARTSGLLAAISDRDWKTL